MPRWVIRVAIFVLALTAPAASAAPRVVASVKPVHSLVAGVMDGVAEPALVLDGGQSPHTYTLSPSEANTVARADLVVWVGPALESFLQRPVRNLTEPAARLRLMAAEGVTSLRTRESGVWEAGHGHGHGNGGDHKHGAESPDAARTDPHIWLSPANARAIVAAVAARLKRIDPAHAETYAANAERLAARLTALDRELDELLAPVREEAYAVFHDAYHYFENHYGLQPVGSVTLSPERQPSAHRIHAVREALTARGAVCVFREPQFAPDLVRTVTEGVDVKTGVLDPVGANLDPGPELYFTLMRELGRGLRDCLQDTG